MAARKCFLAPVVEGSITVGGFVSPAAVAPFYSNGNVMDYMCHNPDVQREVLVGQMALGLAHIHSKGMIHGNFCLVSLCRPFIRMAIDTQTIRKMFASQMTVRCALPTSARTYCYAISLRAGGFQKGGGTNRLKS